MKTYEKRFESTADRDSWLRQAQKPGGVMAGARQRRASGSFRLKGRREAGVVLDTVMLFLTNEDAAPEGFRLVEG